jgi:phosphoglycerate dehydrogenase-like enzyme
VERLAERKSNLTLVDTERSQELEGMARQMLSELVNIRTVNGKIGAELGLALREADVVIISSRTKLTAKVLDEMESCQLIVTTSVGFENVDVETTSSRHIRVANVPNYCIEEVADHTLGLLLALTRKIRLLNKLVEDGRWDQYSSVGQIPRLRGSILGIVGLGRIGTAVAIRAKVLGMEVLVYDPYVPPGKDRSIGVASVDFDSLLRRSDVISMHVPLTNETRHMISTQEFLRMKTGIFLVNTARGAVVDLKALVDALNSGKVAGAGLDVFEKEPPDPNDPLLHMHQVIVTPHTAYLSTSSELDRQEMSVAEVGRFLRKERLRNLVDMKSHSP